MLQWFRKQPEKLSDIVDSQGIQGALIRKLVDFLTGQISTPKKATTVLSQIARFKEFPLSYQEKELTALYLKIEQYLIDEDPLQKYTKSQLRKTVKYRYEPLLELPLFFIIFEQTSVQKYYLCQYFLQNFVKNSHNYLKKEKENPLTSIYEWLNSIPEAFHLKIPFNLAETLPETPDEWLPLLAKVSHNIYHLLGEYIGEQKAASVLEKSYKEIADTYKLLESFYVIVQLLPDNLLDENKIGFLSHEQIRHVFLNKMNYLKTVSDELYQKNFELNEVQNELIIAQDTAMESVKLFHSVLDTVEEGVITTDSQGKIILINKEIQKIFGYTEEELVGQNIQILMPKKYREQHQQGMERYFKTKESRAIGQCLVLEGLKKDEIVFPIEIKITETKITGQLFFTAALRDISENFKQETELNKVTKELRSSEQRYRCLTENLRDIAFTLSLDGTLTSINNAFEKITEWKTDDWIGKPFTQLVHEDDSTTALKLFQQVLQGKTPSLLEINFRVNSLEYLICELSITPQKQDNKIIGGIGLVRNIAKFKKAEETLRTIEQRYNKIVEMSNDAIVTLCEGNLVFINQTGAKLLGADNVNQLLEKPLVEIIHPDSLKSYKEQFKNMKIHGSQELSIKTKLIGLDGKVIFVNLKAIPVVYQNRSAVQLVFQEARKPGSKNGANGKENLASNALFKFSPDAMILTNLNGVIIEVNPSGCQLYKSDSKSLIGKNFLELAPIELRSSLSNHIFELTNGKIDHCKSVNTKTGGESFPVNIWAQQIPFKDKTAVLITVRNTSPQKLIEQENEKLASELKRSQLKFGNTKSQLRELQHKIEELELKLTATTAKYEDAQNQLQIFRQEQKDSQSQFKSVQYQADAGEVYQKCINDLQNKITIFQLQYEQSQIDLKKAKAELESAQNKLIEAQTLNQATQRELNKVQAKYTDQQSQTHDDPISEDDPGIWLKYEATISELRALKAKFGRSQAKLRNTETELNDIRINFENTQARLSKAETEINNVKELETRYNQAQARIGNFQTKLEETQVELLNTRKQVREFSQIQVKYNASLTELTDLRKQLKNTEAELKAAQTDIGGYSFLHPKNGSVDPEVSDLQRKLVDSQNELRDMQKKLETTQKNAQNSLNQFEEIQIQYQNTQLEFQSLKTQINEVQKELQVYQKKIKELGYLIPICSCQKIRDDQEYWQRLETFAQDPLNAEYLTSSCPNCADELSINPSKVKNNGQR